MRAVFVAMLLFAKYSAGLKAIGMDTQRLRLSRGLSTRLFSSLSPTHGPIEVDAYVFENKGEKAIAKKITLPRLKSDEVEIDIQYCGYNF